MKRFVITLLAAGLALGSSSALAQSSYDGYGRGDYGNAGNSGGDVYRDYARVVRVDPVLADGGYRDTGNDRRRCRDTTTASTYYDNDGYGYGDGRRQAGSAGGRTAATIVGGIAGAVLGSKMGGGSGTYVTTTVGSMLGGMAGREIYNQSHTRNGTVRVCDPVPVRDGYSAATGDYGDGIDGYDVTYEYNGRRYTRRMTYNPGDRLRVRVAVQPE